MANLKFSGFTAAAAIDQTDSFLVGFDNDGGGANPTNNKWTFSEVADGLIAVTAKPYSIYAADGTIGAGRVATITDFPKFSGTQSNPIGLEIENTQGSSGQHTTHGAQLKLTSNGASSTISFYNGGGGGGSSPAMKIDSPDGIKHTAAGAYLGNYHAFSGGTWTIGMTNSPLTSSSPRLRMQLGGGGSNGSFYTTDKSGSNDFLYMFMSPGIAARHIALGEYTDSTTTYKDFLRIDSNGNVGINEDAPTEKLHVTGNVKVDGQAYTELHTASSIDANWNDSNVQEVTLSNSDQDFDPNNPKAGATYILKLTQPASGAAGTVNWNASSATVYWPGGTAPTLTATNGAVDIVTLICTSELNSGGSSGGTYYANATLNFS